jgi:hypothetical protein
VVAAVVFASAAGAATGLTATYQITDSWGTGYAVTYTIHNSGTTAVTGWTVAFDLPAGTSVRKYWTAAMTTSGNHYAFANLSYNATVAAGGTQTFGFNTNGMGLAYNCTVNGLPCEGSSPSPTASKSPSPSPSVSPSVSPSPSPSPSTSPSPSPSPSSTGRLVSVSTATQLSSALKNALPGDTIQLASGSYNGAFYATVSGTASAPITLTGPRTAVLSNTGNACDPNVPSGGTVSYCGYGLHLNKASYWKLVGFAVSSSAKGIVFDSANHNVIDGVEVSSIGDEGIHLRTASSDNIVEHSYIHDTGRTDAGYGEGLYFGSAQSNWPKYGENGGTGPDRSDRNQALSNTFGPNVTGEHIDIKEGTTGGLVSGNTFDGRGISGQHYADSWIDTNGNNYLFQGNGCDNVWRTNSSDLGGVGN